ncbi:MAG: hypothetical protein JRI68_14260, partial [Deltaproteobacteria bacterium]|nr:hypothetical protein [Deltaproteobacteria bacterium]
MAPLYTSPQPPASLVDWDGGREEMMARFKRLGPGALLLSLLCGGCSDDETRVSYPPADWAALANRKSGISLGLTGQNGVDWAVESTYNDAAI